MNDKKIIYFIVGILFIACLFIIYLTFNYDKINGKNSKQEYPYDTNRKVNNLYVTEEKSGDRVNNSTVIKSNHSLEGITVSDMTIKSTKKDLDLAELKFNVTNSSEYVIDKLDFFINFQDDRGKNKNSIQFTVENLNPGAKKELKKTISYQILDSYDFSIQKISSLGA